MSKEQFNILDKMVGSYWLDKKAKLKERDDYYKKKGKNVKKPADKGQNILKR